MMYEQLLREMQAIEAHYNEATGGHGPGEYISVHVALSMIERYRWKKLPEDERLLAAIQEARRDYSGWIDRLHKEAA